MTEQPSVLVVGSINVDITVHADRLPAPGETVAGGRLERAGGGKGANQAVAAARAGAAVSLVGAVGDDDLGADALAALRAEGVDVTAVPRLDGRRHRRRADRRRRRGPQPDRGRVGANHAVTAAHVRSAGARAPGCVLASFELLDEPVLAAGPARARGGLRARREPAPARAARSRAAASSPILTPNQHEAGR